MSEQPALPPGWDDEPETMVSDSEDTRQPVLLSYVLQQFIVENDISERTVKNYRNSISIYQTHLERAVTVADLTDDAIGGLIEDRREHVSDQTIRADCERLLSLWRYAALKGLVDSPEVEIPKKTPPPSQAKPKEVSPWVPPVNPSPVVPNTTGLTPQSTILEALDRYLAVNTQIRSDKTRSKYRALFSKIVDHFGRVILVADLTDENLVSFLRMREERVSRNSANTDAHTLLAFVRWCARKQLCEDPDAKPPARIHRRPEALSEQQLRDLFMTALSFPGELRGVTASVFWYALLIVFWQTGERIGAVKQLRWETIDLENGTIRFPPETRKQGQQELIRPINPQAVDALNRLKEIVGDKPPFAVVKGNGFYSHWHALRSAAGLPEWVTPHTIRKCTASHLPTLDDAMRMLGHGDSRMTARHYRDERLTDNRDLLEKLPDVSTPKKRSLLASLFGGGS